MCSQIATAPSAASSPEEGMATRSVLTLLFCCAPVVCMTAAAAPTSPQTMSFPALFTARITEALTSAPSMLFRGTPTTVKPRIPRPQAPSTTSNRSCSPTSRFSPASSWVPSAVGGATGSGAAAPTTADRSSPRSHSSSAGSVPMRTSWHAGGVSQGPSTRASNLRSPWKWTVTRDFRRSASQTIPFALYTPLQAASLSTTKLCRSPRRIRPADSATTDTTPAL
mmetsp:Transcript_31454/g.74745  ORF Transcript_31454/g.74745 Transcript_31454/m.74745 type:complete len:224 (+) Transcript_31454:198-869(+)